MNNGRLLGYFEKIANEPNVVTRLRSFIIELAVCGKIVPTEDIWSQRTLGDLGVWGSGGTPLKMHPEYYNGDIPWLVIGDLNDGLVVKAETHITQAGLEHSSAKIVEPGTVLIAMYGSIGKLGIAGVRCATNQAIAFCAPDTDLVTGDYLFLLLRSLRQKLLAQGQGIAQQNISQKILKAYPVSIPTLAEQKRIVIKSGELMALCDRIESAQADRESVRDRLTMASLARLNAPAPETFQTDARFALDTLPALTTRPDQVKALRQTIVNLAVRGKLVPQDTNDESASELLKRLKTARSELEAAGQLRKDRDDAPAHYGSEQEFELPRNWIWARLIEIGQTQTGTSPSSGNTDLFGNFIPFIKPADLDGNQIRYDGPGLSEIGIEHSRVAAANSILMVCIGATLGKVNTTSRSVCFNQQINSLTPLLGDLTPFIALALKASGFQALAWSKAGTGTLPIISKGKWEQLPIPIPPLAEQQRIVVKVNELMAVCDQLEASLTATRATRRRLLDALLAEALAPVSQEMEAAE